MAVAAAVAETVVVTVVVTMVVAAMVDVRVGLWMVVVEAVVVVGVGILRQEHAFEIMAGELPVEGR